MSITRSIFNKLKADFSKKEATILVGPRQVGKTFLLRKLHQEAIRSHQKSVFFDLEQPTDLARFNRSEGEIVEMLRQSGEVIFIDECQYLKNASKIFKAIYDGEKRVKIFASGSSALEIHTHLRESLAGRKFLYHIFPCSLEEIKQAVPTDAFEYYCLYGGMPGTVHQADAERKKMLLADILQSYILKDVKALLREERLSAFNHLLFLLAQSQGSPVMIDGLARDVSLSPHTINDYLDILSQTYVNFPLFSYSLNFGNELRKSKKYYLYDIGIRNALLKNFAALTERADAGVIVETFVFLQLRCCVTPETELRFWRLKSGEEVDFLWIKNQIPIPVEVKLNWERPAIPKGMAAFLRRYPQTPLAYVVSRQAGPSITCADTKVNFLPFERAAEIAGEGI